MNYYKDIPYIKWFNGMTDAVVAALAEGKFPTHDKEKWASFKSDVGLDRVIAIVEFPYMDIELEMYTKYGDWDEADDDDNEVSLSYFACTKDSNGEWQSDDFVWHEVNVDFSKSDWEDALAEDMCKALEKHAKDNGFFLDKPND